MQNSREKRKNLIGIVTIQIGSHLSPFAIVMFILIILLSLLCRCLASDRKDQEENPRSAEHLLDSNLPPYIRVDLAKTGSMSQQRRAYTSSEISSPRPISGVAKAITPTRQSPVYAKQKVQALRGGEFIGNRMRFKVKVLNESEYTITDVKVFLISYPKTALRLASEDDDVLFPKIEPSGFRSPTFDFLPTQDCVQGEILVGVSYIDERGRPQLLHTKPFIIRSVCDLLLPDQISPNEFELKLKKLECGEIIVKVTEWTPEEMFEKVLRILEDSNFFEVASDSSVKNNIFQATISGFAKGKYTGKSVATKIMISGVSKKEGASCTIQVSGEDQAMIFPTIDDLRERLSAWLCPMCGSPLSIKNVELLKDGKVVVCPFCNVSIGR